MTAFNEWWDSSLFRPSRTTTHYEFAEAVWTEAWNTAAAWEEATRQERERIAELAEAVHKYDADLHYDGDELTGAFVVDADLWGELKDWAAGVVKNT